MRYTLYNVDYYYIYLNIYKIYIYRETESSPRPRVFTALPESVIYFFRRMCRNVENGLKPLGDNKNLSTFDVVEVHNGM